jgi:hypothetical protein
MRLGEVALGVADEARAGGECAQPVALGVGGRRGRQERQEDRDECPADRYASMLA